MPLTRVCQEPSCGAVLNRWRSCGGDPDCKVETVYCDPHGGDARMVLEITGHIETNHRGALKLTRPSGDPDKENP